MRRSAPKSVEEAKSLACSVDELNVPFNAGITYTDKVVSIINTENMAVIRRYGDNHTYYIRGVIVAL